MVRYAYGLALLLVLSPASAGQRICYQNDDGSEICEQDNRTQYCWESHGHTYCEAD